MLERDVTGSILGPDQYSRSWNKSEIKVLPLHFCKRLGLRSAWVTTWNGGPVTSCRRKYSVQNNYLVLSCSILWQSIDCVYIIALTVGTTSSHPNFSYRCCYGKGDDHLNPLFSWSPNSSLFSVFSSLTSPSLLKRGTRNWRGNKYFEMTQDHQQRVREN